MYFLSVIFIASAFPMGKNYYALVFLEECEYIFMKKKISKYISDNLKVSPDDSVEETVDESDDSSKRVAIKDTDEK